MFFNGNVKLRFIAEESSTSVQMDLGGVCIGLGDWTLCWICGPNIPIVSTSGHCDISMPDIQSHSLATIIELGQVLVMLSNEYMSIWWLDEYELAPCKSNHFHTNHWSVHTKLQPDYSIWEIKLFVIKCSLHNSILSIQLKRWLM